MSNSFSKKKNEKLKSFKKINFFKSTDETRNFRIKKNDQQGFVEVAIHKLPNAKKTQCSNFKNCDL